VSLNVKNPRAYELASELSRLTGESLTTVVIQSLEERLAKERKRESKDDFVKRMLAFTARFSEGLDRNLGSADLTDQLYDESGLPKCLTASYVSSKFDWNQ